MPEAGIRFPPPWSDREIARRCAVSPGLVDNMRGSLPTVGSDTTTEPRKFTTKHGTVATMRVTPFCQIVSTLTIYRPLGTRSISSHHRQKLGEGTLHGAPLRPAVLSNPKHASLSPPSWMQKRLTRAA